MRQTSIMIGKLSIFIITKNEADRIGRTLAAIRGLSDDILVIDSGSNDGTQEIAQGFGARVIHNDWQGYGLQKQFGEDNCQHGWLLNLDADEVISPQIHAQIAAIINAETPPQAFEIGIAEVFPFETAPKPWAYALWPVRLYHKSIGRYNPSTVHDRVDLVSGTKITRLQGLVAHYSVRSLGDQLVKLNSYADAQAQDMFARGKRVWKIRLFFEFPIAFLKAYFGRRHFLRGSYGFMSAMNYGFYRYLRIAKYFEAKSAPKNEN